MIHTCNNCGSGTYHANDSDPRCWKCRLKRSQVALVPGSFRVRVREKADVERLGTMPAGQLASAVVLIKVTNGPCQEWWVLDEARDLLEPFERELVPLRDLVPNARPGRNLGVAAVLHGHLQRLADAIGYTASSPGSPGAWGPIIDHVVECVQKQTYAHEEELVEQMEQTTNPVSRETLERFMLGGKTLKERDEVAGEQGEKFIKAMKEVRHPNQQHIPVCATCSIEYDSFVCESCVGSKPDQMRKEREGKLLHVTAPVMTVPTITKEQYARKIGANPDHFTKVTIPPIDEDNEETW